MKLIESKEDFDEKSHRLGWAKVESHLEFSTVPLPFEIDRIAIHEQTNEKGTRRWVAFRSYKSGVQNEKGYDLYLPICKFKETVHHGEFATWLWREVNRWKKENATASSQNNSGNGSHQPSHKTQHGANYSGFNGDDEGVPF